MTAAAGPALRLFVALELPRDVRAQLAGWADAVAPAEVRRVPEQNLHVTMAFLGSCSAADAAAVGGLLPALARPIGLLTTSTALWLPPRRPGVLAVALGGESGLRLLHADLVVALVAAVGYRGERRAWRPHVTVGRVRRGMRPRAQQPDPPPPALAFHAEALVLYRSHTRPGGARYEPLSRASLSS